MNALKDPKLLVVALLGILVLWAIAQSSFSSITGERVRTREATESRTVRSADSEPDEELLEYGYALSPLMAHVELRRARAREEDPREEYLELRADDDNQSSVTITGWKVRSVRSGHVITIGNASGIPIYPGENIATTPVSLRPGDRAYVISGVSPIQTSFRTNMCTGYLGENRTFHPRLARECPNPEDERLEDFHIDSTPKEDSSDDQCIRALKRIGRCEDPGAPDDELSRDCREYIREISYGLCARLHVSDSDFFGDEWYLYVGSRFSDIWGDESDTILLLDGSGRLVDALTY